jgi:ribonuclease HII
LADSKLLTAKQRQALFAAIAGYAIAIGLGRAEAEEVDRINVYWAAMEARRRAVAGLRRGILALRSRESLIA